VDQVRVDPTIPLAYVPDVEFARAAGRPLLLDAVRPQGRLDGEPEGPRPAVLYIGEPWVRGVRSRDPWLHAYLATHGFFAATCDVRSFTEAPFPAQLHDVKAAIRWLRASAAAYGVDPDRIGVWGVSIAATLAALVGLTGDSGNPELEGDVGQPAHRAYSTRAQAVVWASGAADFPRQWAEKPGLRDQLARAFGGPLDGHPGRARLAHLASPLHHVRHARDGGGQPPPFLLLHGTRDETTPLAPAAAFCTALGAAGGEVELVPLLGRRHNWTGLVDNPDETWRYWDMAPMALPFFIRHLRPRAPGATTRCGRPRRDPEDPSP